MTRVVKVTSHGLSTSRATPVQRKNSSYMIPKIKAVDEDIKKVDERLIHTCIHTRIDGQTGGRGN